MSTNISKKKRDDLLDKIKQIRAFIAAAPQDENTGNLLSYLPVGALLDLDRDPWLDRTPAHGHGCR